MAKRLIEGKVLDFGVAPLYDDPENKNSFFIHIENGKPPKVWGVGIREALENNPEIEIGSHVSLVELGSQDVSIPAPTPENPSGIKTVKKNIWAISEIEPIVDLTNSIELDDSPNLDKITPPSEPTRSEKIEDLSKKVTDLVKASPSPVGDTDIRHAITEEIAKDYPDTIKEAYQYRLKNAYGTNQTMHFYSNDNPSIVAFEDRTKGLHTSLQDPDTIKDMIAVAQGKGWSSLKLRGTPEFKQRAWLEATLLGMETKGYVPTEADLAQLQAEQKARTKNEIVNRDAKEVEASEPIATAQYDLATDVGRDNQLFVSHAQHSGYTVANLTNNETGLPYELQMATEVSNNRGKHNLNLFSTYDDEGKHTGEYNLTITNDGAVEPQRMSFESLEEAIGAFDGYAYRIQQDTTIDMPTIERPLDEVAISTPTAELNTDEVLDSPNPESSINALADSDLSKDSQYLLSQVEKENFTYEAFQTKDGYELVVSSNINTTKNNYSVNMYSTYDSLEQGQNANGEYVLSLLNNDTREHQTYNFAEIEQLMDAMKQRTDELTFDLPTKPFANPVIEPTTTPTNSIEPETAPVIDTPVVDTTPPAFEFSATDISASREQYYNAIATDVQNALGVTYDEARTVVENDFFDMPRKFDIALSTLTSDEYLSDNSENILTQRYHDAIRASYEQIPVREANHNEAMERLGFDDIDYADYDYPASEMTVEDEQYDADLQAYEDGYVARAEAQDERSLAEFEARMRATDHALENIPDEELQRDMDLLDTPTGSPTFSDDALDYITDAQVEQVMDAKVAGYDANEARFAEIDAYETEQQRLAETQDERELGEQAMAVPNTEPEIFETLTDAMKTYRDNPNVDQSISDRELFDIEMQMRFDIENELNEMGVNFSNEDIEVTVSENFENEVAKYIASIDQSQTVEADNRIAQNGQEAPSLADEVNQDNAEIIDAYAHNLRVDITQRFRVLPDEQQQAILGDYDKGIEALFDGKDKADISVQEVLDVLNDSDVVHDAWQKASDNDHQNILATADAFYSDPVLSQKMASGERITEADLQGFDDREHAKMVNETIEYAEANRKLDSVSYTDNLDKGDTLAEQYRHVSGVNQDISDDELKQIERDLEIIGAEKIFDGELGDKPFQLLSEAEQNDLIADYVQDNFISYTDDFIVERDLTAKGLTYNEINELKENLIKQSIEQLPENASDATRNQWANMKLPDVADGYIEKVSQQLEAITQTDDYKKVANALDYASSQSDYKGEPLAGRDDNNVMARLNLMVEVRSKLDSAIQSNIRENQPIDDRFILVEARKAIETMDLNNLTDNQRIAFKQEFENSVAGREAPSEIESMIQDYRASDIGRQSNLDNETLTNIAEAVYSRAEQDLREEFNVAQPSREAVMKEIEKYGSFEQAVSEQVGRYQDESHLSEQSKREDIDNLKQSLGQSKDFDANTQIGLQTLKNVIDAMPDGDKKTKAIEAFSALNPTAQQQAQIPQIVVNKMPSVEVQATTQGNQDRGL